MLRRSEEREPGSPLEVDKELAAEGRQVSSTQKRPVRSEIGVLEPMVKAHELIEKLIHAEEEGSGIDFVKLWNYGKSFILQ